MCGVGFKVFGGGVAERSSACFGTPLHCHRSPGAGSNGELVLVTSHNYSRGLRGLAIV